MRLALFLLRRLCLEYTVWSECFDPFLELLIVKEGWRLVLQAWLLLSRSPHLDLIIIFCKLVFVIMRTPIRMFLDDVIVLNQEVLILWLNYFSQLLLLRSVLASISILVNRVSDDIWLYHVLSENHIGCLRPVSAAGILIHFIILIERDNPLLERWFNLICWHLIVIIIDFLSIFIHLDIRNWVLHLQFFFLKSNISFHILVFFDSRVGDYGRKWS